LPGNEAICSLNCQVFMIGNTTLSSYIRFYPMQRGRHISPENATNMHIFCWVVLHYACFFLKVNATCCNHVVLASLVPRPRVGGKSGLVSTVCACAKTPMISWGIVYHRLRTVNLYRTAPKHGRLKLIPRTWQVTVRTLIKRSSSVFVALRKDISR